MSSNISSSLENIKTLLDSLIKSKDNKVSEFVHFRKVIIDFAEILIESDSYDIEIRVGIDQDVKIFKAHSAILKARSLYFRAALSDNWMKKSENGIILFEKENIPPKLFEVLLM